MCVGQHNVNASRYILLQLYTRNLEITGRWCR